MTAEAKEKPEETAASPEATAFWERLGKERTAEFMKDLENLMKSDTLEHNGETFHFCPLKNKDRIRFNKLDAESFKIEDKNGEEWYNNVKERACIIIEGMTPEKFDEGDSIVIENMVTAWSSRALRGFHRAKSGV